MDKSIGELIRAMRKANGMSQSALAEKIGVSYQQVQKYEKSGGITVSRIVQIADAFGIPVNALLNTADAEQTKPKYQSFSEDELKLIMLYRGLGKKKLKDGFIEILESIRDISKKSR